MKPIPDDGGPAFPVPWEYADNEAGMSLRDYLAAKALTGLLSSERSWGAKTYAREAYDIADAMLDERKARMALDEK